MVVNLVAKEENSSCVTLEVDSLDWMLPFDLFAPNFQYVSTRGSAPTWNTHCPREGGKWRVVYMYATNDGASGDFKLGGEEY